MAAEVRSWALALALALALMLVAATPPGAEPVDHLARARICVAMLDYECAETELQAERAQITVPGSDRHADVYQLSAEVALATERPRDAASHLEALLKSRPDFEPPAGTWPKSWLSALEGTRGAMPDVGSPVVGVAVSPQPVENRPLVITIDAEDRSGVGRVVLSVASGTARREFVLATTDGKQWSAEIPAELVRAPHIDLWLEVYDRLGNGPTRWGSEAKPQRLLVEAKAAVQDESILEQWWFWTAIGVAVVGGTVAIIALTGDDTADAAGPTSSQVGDLNVGVIVLQPQ